MRRTTPRVLSSLLVLLLAGGLAACQDGASLGPEPQQPSAARGGGPGGQGSGSPTAGCDLLVPDDRSTIQAGVDAAGEGDVVCVKPEGPYREQVLVTKSLTLRGLDGPVLEAPDAASAEEFTIAESGPTWEPIVFVHGGSADASGHVSGPGTIEASVSGLVVDGRDLQPEARRKVGVLYRNAHGTVAGNTVRRMGVGAKETMGILAYGDSEVTITGNTVTGYERGGIGANGDGGAHPAPKVVIADNELTGSGDGSRTAWAPNGIQVGFGATGRIMDNEVHRSRWAAAEDDAWSASCILVFESDGVRIRGNEVTDCDVGIGVGAWAWLRPSADNTKVVDNRVDGALVGLELETIAWEGFSYADPSVSNAKLTGNRLAGTLPSGASGAYGVLFETVDQDPGFDPVADDNKVINNHITGFDVRIETGSATNTRQAANRPFNP